MRIKRVSYLFPFLWTKYLCMNPVWQFSDRCANTIPTQLYLLRILTLRAHTQNTFTLEETETVQDRIWYPSTTNDLNIWISACVWSNIFFKEVFFIFQKYFRRAAYKPSVFFCVYKNVFQQGNDLISHGSRQQCKSFLFHFLRFFCCGKIYFFQLKKSMKKNKKNVKQPPYVVRLM